jgi:NADPH:quinone reductase-like Zn-dependent oxidoreductase
MATKPMKQAIVHPDLSVEIVSVAIPVPTASQVLIKVEIAGSNPKDWYVNSWSYSIPETPFNPSVWLADSDNF